VNPMVDAACEFLGLDPLYVANEASWSRSARRGMRSGCWPRCAPTRWQGIRDHRRGGRGQARLRADDHPTGRQTHRRLAGGRTVAEDMLMRVPTIFWIAALAIQSTHAADFDSNEFIAAHNRWRAEVGVKEKLSYSPALAKSAQAWAGTLKKTNHCQMRHSNPDGKYGENLYWGSALQWSDGRLELQKVTPQQVVMAGAARRRITTMQTTVVSLARCAGTTPKSSGAAPRPSAARWPCARIPSNRCGCANTSRRKLVGEKRTDHS